MSILLDAVTRAKQQQLDSNLDPVLAPRIPIAKTTSLPWKPIAVVMMALLAGGALAFAWHWQVKAVSTVTPEPQVPAVVSVPQVKTDTAKDTAADAGVRVAGRAALPIAQPLPSPQYAAQVATSQPNQAVAVDKTVTPSAQPQVVESVAANDGNDPIILGAQPNQRGLQALQDLKNEVQTAADETGIEDQPQPQSQPVQEDQQALIAKFQAALSEVERRNAIDKPMTPTEEQPLPKQQNLQYPSYGNLPASLQLQVPEFNITAHMYATDPTKRWLNVDGKELQEGDKIKSKLKIIEIRPRDVVLDIQGTRFKVPAI